MASYEKLPVDETEPVTFRREEHTRRNKLYRRFAIVALIAIVLFARPWSPLLDWQIPTRHECNHATRYEGEHIAWERVGEINNRTLETSRLLVPMDQFGDNSAGKTFNLSLIRLRGKDGSPNLFLNPGGPGGSGIGFVHRAGAQLSEIVGDGYHLLSFDPRGINGSTPIGACYSSPEAKERLGRLRSTEVIHDSPEAFAWSQNFAKACAETTDEHGLYINTPQTAADMNSILDAVGQKDMHYWGFSYGTSLGATYAGLFPQKSHRVIIDGVLNNFYWYNASGTQDFEALSDTERVFDGFFDECIKAGKNCSLSAHGDTKEQLHDVISDVLNRIRQQPVPVYINNTNYGLLTHDTVLLSGVFTAMYKPTTWYVLADNLAKLVEGNATAAFEAYHGRAPSVIGEGGEFVQLNDAPSGVDGGYEQDREKLLEQIVSFVNKTSFAPTFIEAFYVREHWSLPRTTNFTQQKHVETSHPLLILSTTFDPICPLVSAKTMHGVFQGSGLVEVKGYGHCSIAAPSTCLAKHVRAFLYNGTVPNGHVTCEVDGHPYFVRPEEDGRVTALKHFDDAEDHRLHLAQLQYAREMEW